MATPEDAKAMKELIDTLRLQVEDLNTRLVKAEENVKKADEPKAEEASKDDEKGKVKDIKGFDVKNMPRPESYDRKSCQLPSVERNLRHSLYRDGR